LIQRSEVFPDEQIVVSLIRQFDSFYRLMLKFWFEAPECKGSGLTPILTPISRKLVMKGYGKEAIQHQVSRAQECDRLYDT
jgi:hypothetical protein